jgi:hypothetical protein
VKERCRRESKDPRDFGRRGARIENPTEGVVLERVRLFLRLFETLQSKHDDG